jgi:hypothetical protein
MIDFYKATESIPFGLEKGVRLTSGNYHFELTPLCSDREPRTDTERGHAIVAVAKTLRKIHRVGWYHGDVRWPNIRPDERPRSTCWTLIDCEFVLPRRCAFADIQKDQFADAAYSLAQQLPKDREEKVDLALVDMKMVGILSDDFVDKTGTVYDLASQLTKTNTEKDLIDIFDKLCNVKLEI